MNSLWKNCAGAALLLCAGALQAFTPPFDDARVKADDSQKSYWLFGGSPDRLIAGIGAFPQEYYKDLKVECKDGELIIDTRDMFKNGLKGQSVTVRFYGIPLANAARLAPDKKLSETSNRLSYHMKGEPAGIESILFMEGQEIDDKGKPVHYWRATPSISDGTMQNISIEQVLPRGIKDLWARVDLRKPGVYTFEGVDFSQFKLPVPKFDPKKNYITNGGAERGWDSVMTTCLDQKQSSDNGKFVDFRKVEIKYDSKFTLDDKVFHSGKRSFKIESPQPESSTDFRFAPVPFVLGKRVDYTAWIKADKPGTYVELSVLICSGHATGRGFIVGTEWTRCQMTVPAWGDNHGNCYIIGDMVSNPSIDIGTVSAGIHLGNRQATVWVDDASWHVGGEKADFQDDSKVWMRGELNHDNHYYFPGEKIVANLELENAVKQPVETKFYYEILDFFGKPVFKSAPETIKLQPDQTEKRDVTVAVPPEMRGPFNVRFSCETGDSKDFKAFYLGVINPAPKQGCPRVGVEISGEQNIKRQLPLLRDFAIGSVRVGGASSPQERAMALTPFLKEAGISVLFTTGLSHEQRDDEAKWQAYFKDLAGWMDRYGKNIDYFETQNEANIDNWSIDQNLRQIQDLAKVAKKHAPHAKLAGPTPCSTDFTWIDNVLRRGGKDLLDVVTEHPYRKFPELPDYAEDSIAVEKIIAMHKPGMEHFGTEAGNVHQPQLPEGMISEYERITAIRDARNMIQGVAGGVKRYYNFAMNGWVVGGEWNCTYAGNPGNRNILLPGPQLFAMRTFADMVGTAPCVDRVKLGLNYRCHIFDRGDKRVAVMWKWKGEPTTMDLNADAAKSVKVYDFGGTPVKSAALPLNETPLYVESALSAADLAKLISTAKLHNTDGQSLNVTTGIRDADKFALELKNITGSPIDVDITILNTSAIKGEAKYQVKGIEPEATREVLLTAARPIDTKLQKVKVLTKTSGAKDSEKFTVALRGILVRKADKPITVDGDLSDWPANAVTVKLDKADANGKTAAWGAAADKITAELKYAWDDDNLYTAVIVNKPDYYPWKDATHPDNMYIGDSIQTCFDPLRNGKPEGQQFDDDDFEYALGNVAGKDLVFRRWASSAAYDSLPKKQGVLDEVKFATKVLPGKVIYEAAFPRRSVSPFKLRNFATMRTCTIVNVNDGKDRIGYLQLTPGVGDTKTPGKWMDLILLP